MSISNNYIPTKQQGDGVTLEYTASWPVFNADYLVVIFEDITTGVQTVQTTGFTVAFTSSSVTPTFSVAPPSSVYVILARSIPLSQQTPYKTSSGFQGKKIETSLDILTAITQDLQDDVERSIKFPTGASGITNASLPTPLDGYGVVWNGTTGALRNTESSLAVLEGNAAIVAADIDNIDIVADDIDSVNTTAGSIANINIVGAGIDEVNQAAEALGSVYQWTFSSNTTIEDPSTGNIRLNNASPSSVTSIAVSANTSQSGNPDVSDYIATWDDSTNAVKGTLRLMQSDDATDFAIYNVTGVTDNGAWLELDVTHVTSAGTFSASDTLYVSFDATGDKGVDGAGDMSGPISSTDNAIARFNGTDGSILQNSGVLVDDTDRIKNLTDPTDLQDAATKAYVDANGGADIGNAGYVTGRYYNGGLIDQNAVSSLPMAANRLYYIPFIVGAEETFTRIGINVATSAGGTSVRLGIYNMADGVPSSLLLDAGTVSSATTGEKEVTISQLLSAGIYALAMVSDGTPAVSTGGGNDGLMQHIMGLTAYNSTGSTVSIGGYTAHTFGALPSPFGSITYMSASLGPYNLWLRKV